MNKQEEFQKSRDEYVRDYWHSFKGTALENDEQFKSAIMSAATQAYDKGADESKRIWFTDKAINFSVSKPRKWARKDGGKIMKVMRLFVPMEDPAKHVDYTELMESIDKSFVDELQGRKIYSGLMMETGYLIENHNRMWIGLMLTPAEARDLFEDQGEWQDSDEASPLFQPDEGAAHAE